MPNTKAPLLHIGYGSYILTEKVTAIHDHRGSVPLVTMLREAAKIGRVVDATRGKKVKSIIHTDNNCFTLCALDAETLAIRLRKGLKT